MTFAPRFIYGDLDLTDAPFMVEFGLDLGNAQAVTAVIDSLLTDGELISGERDSNREITLTVLVEGSDLAELADAEALLVAQARKQRNTLTVEPGDDIGPTTVFDTFRAQVEWQRDDDFERSNLRRFVLTIPALPFTRSANKILDVSTSPPGAGAGTVFYSAESTTGWTSYGAANTTPSWTVDGTIYNEGAGSIKSLVVEWYDEFLIPHSPSTPGGYYTPAKGYSRDEITGLSLVTGTGGYVSVAIRFDPLYDLARLTKVYQSTSAGVWTEVTTFAAIKYATNGFVTYRWPVGADLTILGFRFEAYHERDAEVFNQERPHVWYDDFRFADTASTEQQIIKTIQVDGSARTVGSLRVASGLDSVGLGQVLIATVPTDAIPAGFSPETRPYAVQGTLTPDADAQGGSYYTPHASTYSDTAGYPIFDIPVAILHAGAYTVVTLVQTGGADVTSGVQAQLNVNGTLVGATQTAEVTRDSTTSDWQFVPVGTLILPPVAVVGADLTTSVRLLFKGDILANCYLIPAWTVGGRSVADLSIIDCGAGLASASGPSSYLWIDSPDANQPQGGYWRGPASDRLNARSAWPDAIAPGIHAFPPGEITAFLAVTASQAPTLALEYYPAWHSSAAI